MTGMVSRLHRRWMVRYWEREGGGEEQKQTKGHFALKLGFAIEFYISTQKVMAHEKCIHTDKIVFLLLGKTVLTNDVYSTRNFSYGL